MVDYIMVWYVHVKDNSISCRTYIPDIFVTSKFNTALKYKSNFCMIIWIFLWNNYPLVEIQKLNIRISFFFFQNEHAWDFVMNYTYAIYE